MPKKTFRDYNLRYGKSAFASPKGTNVRIEHILPELEGNEILAKLRAMLESKELSYPEFTVRVKALHMRMKK